MRLDSGIEKQKIGKAKSEHKFVTEPMIFVENSENVFEEK